MTKRTDVREELQTDLFGAPAQRAAPKQQRAVSARTVKAPSISAPVLHEPPVLLDVRQAAARLNLSKSTLDKMRVAGKGPRFIRSGERAVRYDPADLDAWIASRRSETHKS